jgi:hypothetical protein
MSVTSSRQMTNDDDPSELADLWQSLPTESHHDDLLSFAPHEDDQSDSWHILELSDESHNAVAFLPSQ